MSDEQSKTIEAPTASELGYPLAPGVYAAESSPLILGTSTEEQKKAEAEGDKPAAKTTSRTAKS